MSNASERVASDPWLLPAMTGPVVSFRGKRPDATEVEHESQRATREGYARGREEGLAAAAEEMSQLRRRLQQQTATVEGLLQQMARPLERLDAGATQELVQLALRVGAELAGIELRAQPEKILQLAQQAVGQLPSASREVRLLLHPLDFAALNSRAGNEVEASGWRVLADPQVRRGGCRILLDCSEIDANFDSRIAAIAEALFAEAPPMPGGDVTAELAAEQGEL
jgi:flagellar assembly protein FliH